jgi:hypothetical protein
MIPYPPVIGEFDTIAAVLRGKSLARLGDGELKLIGGKSYFREPENEVLGAELLAVLQRPHRRCLVGIPTLDERGPKYQGWIRHRDRFAKLLRPERLEYHSAFITRPDSAPWIKCIEFACLMEQLWSGKRAAVLCEPGNKILKAVRLSAKKVKHFRCPHREAYAQIDDMEKEIAAAKPEIALLSCGPTATCLANRLAARGIHAVDIGSAGGFLLKLLINCEQHN